MQKKLFISLLSLITISGYSNADIVADHVTNLNRLSMQQDSSLWQRMRDGFALDHSETKEVKYWEKRYGSPKYFNIIMQNAAPYLYFVVGEMERRGIPLELALIPIVESTYNPNAISPAAVSTGMWQFLAGSGKRFGMTINSNLDERKDIVKSTRGAVAYLQYLHDLFGNWELAIAAYNWGEGNINNAVNSSNSKNFYDLDVRDVTKQYVPKVIALANIIQNPSKFGIKLIDLPNKPYFAITYPPTTIAVSDFMTQANMDTTLNKKLNPQYSSTSYKVTSSQRLLLPISNQPTYLANIGQALIAPTIATSTVINPNNIVATPSNNNVTSDNNDTDPINALIAQNSTTANPSPAANTISNKNQADVNSLLIDNVPINSTDANYTSYTVTQGDTLYSIARKFATSVEQIQADNQLSDSGVRLNQTLRIRNNS